MNQKTETPRLDAIVIGKPITEDWLWGVGFDLDEEGVWVLDCDDVFTLCPTHSGPPQTYLLTIDDRVMWCFDIQTIGQVILLAKWAIGCELKRMRSR